MFRVLFKAQILILLISLPAIGQTAQRVIAVVEVSKTGSITGRVVNESGQPLPNARIFATSTDARQRTGQTTTDREGTFKVTGLEPVLYQVYVDIPAYIRPSDQPESGPPKRYKAGESVTFVLTKGGVITGTVTNAAGDPVIGIGVQALIKRNHKDQPTIPIQQTREVTTDDRGVYRIYGLPAGTYNVVAGANNIYSRGPFGAFDDFLPTYAPSSSRDTAAEISVRTGEETSNIDITFRGEMGRTVSGTTRGPGIEGGVTVKLSSVAAPSSQSDISRYSQPGVSQFIFHGIADGDYYLTAQTNAPTGEVTFSEPKLIRVRGADIEDVELVLKTLGEVSGRVLLEESKASECQGKDPPAFKDMAISAWHRDNEAARSQPQFIWSTGAPVNPDPQGNFTIRNLASSQYYFVARFPVRSWYLKSIAMQPPAPARKPSDVTRVWTTVKTGDRLSGLLVTLAQGAALFQGQLVLSEGETIPEGLFVYLIPSEREAADELLRFYGGNVSKDGKIGLYNLAPGRYWILARQADTAQAPLAKMRLPDGTETRAQLRRDAEAAKMEIELKPCQSVLDYRLPFKN